jgi:hypothetical protein
VFDFVEFSNFYDFFQLKIVETSKSKQKRNSACFNVVKLKLRKMKDKKEEKCESETSVESNLRKHVKHYDKADISWPVKGDLRIPEKVFRECFENCKKFNGTSYKHLNKLDRIMKYCYKKKKLDFSFRKARPFSSFHLLTAAEIALNNRNYRTLYEIINKCLTLPFDYPFIWQQMKNVSNLDLIL